MQFINYLAEKGARYSGKLFAALAVNLFLASTSFATIPLPPPPEPPASCPQGAVAADCPTLSSAGPVTTMLTNAGLNLADSLGRFTNGFFSGGNTTTAAAGSVNRVALNAGQTGVAASAGDEKWHAWSSIGRNNVAYSFSPLDSSGHADVAMIGLDYTFSNNLITGAVLSSERTRVDTNYNSGNIRGSGNTFAPYLSWQINRAWTLDASMGFGYTDLDLTDNSGATVTGSNRDKRSFGNIGLSWNHVTGNWLLTGKGNLLTASDRLSAYTLSNGTAVAQFNSRVNQARIGAQAAYDAGRWMPFAGLTYIYDLKHEDQAPVAGVSAANDRSGYQAMIGVSVRSKGSLTGGVTYLSELGRSEVKNRQLVFNIGLGF